MRKEIVEDLIKEVIGPREGPLEKISFDPWQEYLCGVIIPKSWKSKDDGGVDNPDGELLKEDVGNYDEDDISDDLNATTQSELDPRYQTKSFGISFILDSPNTKFEICTTWGMYSKNHEISKEFVESDDLEEIWSRESFGKINSVYMDNNQNNHKISLLELENHGSIYLYIKKLQLSDSKCHVSVYLVNDIIDHYENYRSNILTGKAMIVAYSRGIAMQIYNKILEHGIKSLEGVFQK